VSRLTEAARQADAYLVISVHERAGKALYNRAGVTSHGGGRGRRPFGGWEPLPTESAPKEGHSRIGEQPLGRPKVYASDAIRERQPLVPRQ
jgi:hypothetical protein